MKKLFFIAFLVLIGMSLSAQNVDDVTLVVSGDGATKEEATHVALRSAIEQAYGVFVSANTEILNDELVKDEIATVTSGNVKSYKELTAVILPNGNHMVSLQAVVSTKKLSAYAQSKGASCEFAGATFGANLKLHELNCKNTEIAFNNLRKQIKALAPYIFSVKLELGDPVMGDNQKAELPYKILLYSTPQTYELSDLIITTLSALKLSPEQANSVIQMNLPYYSIFCGTQKYVSEGKERGWKGNDAWDQPLFKRKPSQDLYLFPYQYEYDYYNYYYAPFPSKEVCWEIFELLPSYCIVDNLGTQYNYTLSDELIKWTIISDNDVRLLQGWGEYRAIKFSSFSCFTFAGDRITLPYSYIAPKVIKKATKKKPAEVIFTPQYIGQVVGELTIPVDVLTKVTNFELKQIE